MVHNGKKVFDITPSRRKEKREEIFEVKSTGDAVLPYKNKKRLAPFAVLAILAALVSSYFFIPAKAKVEIWPEKKYIEEITAAVVSPVREGTGFIQGEAFEAEKVVSQTFAVQGRKLKETEARGIIRVYNNYSAASQVLVAATRFVSDDGKLFRTPKRVVVPGGRYEGGKLEAGFIDIEVVADQPGEEYNIDASTFSIPGFAGTSRYTAFYAKSFESMTGGVKKEVPYVSREDLDRAGEILTGAALAESKAALRKLISSSQYILIEEAISASAGSFNSSAELGQELESFSVQVKAAAKAVAFMEGAMIDFSKAHIREKILPEDKLIERFLKIDYSLEAADLGKNELVLKLVISAQSYSMPEDNQIKEMIKNKDAREVENIIRNIPQVKKAKIEFWPFWVNLAPGNSDGIEVVWHLD